MAENTDKNKVVVTFPHRSADGKAREVGQSYELTGQEYRDRINDRFVVDAASEPAKAAKAESK